MKRRCHRSHLSFYLSPRQFSIVIVIRINSNNTRMQVGTVVPCCCTVWRKHTQFELRTNKKKTENKNRNA